MARVDKKKIYPSRRDSTSLWQETQRRLQYAVVMVLCVLGFGTIGYMILEKYTLIEALYMTVITIATVGFQEIRILSDNGRLFTIFLIFLGIGTGSYSIGIIAAMLVEGYMLDILKGRRMVREITSLRKHAIVCGYGKIGREVCVSLAEAGQAFVVIDNNEDKIEQALEKGYLAAVGDATDDEVLLRAGIKNASGLVSAISEDSANIYLVLTARALNDRLMIVARGVGEAYQKKMIRAGANKVVSPFEIGARRMAALLLRPEIVDFLEALSPGRTYGLRIERIELKSGSPLVNKRLQESFFKRDTDGAMVLGIGRPNGEMKINPPGETMMQAGDNLLSIGNDTQLQKLTELAQ